MNKGDIYLANMVGWIIERVKDKVDGEGRFQGQPFPNPISKKDSEDCLKKIVLQMQQFGFIGLSAAAIDVIMIQKPTPDSVGKVLARAGKWLGPAIAVGAAYGSTACIIGSLRQKERLSTHFAAGMTAGSIIGTACKRFQVGVYWGLFFGLGGMLLKYATMEDWNNVVPDNVVKHQGAFLHYESTHNFGLGPKKRQIEFSPEFLKEHPN